MKKLSITIAILAIAAFTSANAQLSQSQINSNLTAQINALATAMGVSVTNYSPVYATSNGVVDTNSIGGEVAPLVGLLQGKGTWATTAIAWLLALATALAPFRTLIRHTIADKFNAYAAASSTEDNAYLRALFSKPWYIGFSILISFAGITLPNLADLDRALNQQNQAVAAAVAPKTAPVAQAAVSTPPKNTI